MSLLSSTASISSKSRPLLNRSCRVITRRSMLPAEFNLCGALREATPGLPSAVVAGIPPTLRPGSCGELPSVEGGVLTPEEPPASVWECGPLGWRGDRMTCNGEEARQHQRYECMTHIGQCGERGSVSRSRPCLCLGRGRPSRGYEGDPLGMR